MADHLGRQKQPLSGLAFILFGFAALAGAFALMRAELTWLPYMYGEWNAATATVRDNSRLQVQWRGSRVPYYVPVMHYEYTVKSLPYQGTTFHAPPDHIQRDREDALKVFARHAVGSQVPIFYRSDRPDLSFAIRNRAGYFADFVGYWLIALSFAAGGLAVARNHVRQSRASKANP